MIVAFGGESRGVIIGHKVGPCQYVGASELVCIEENLQHCHEAERSIAMRPKARVLIGRNRHIQLPASLLDLAGLACHCRSLAALEQRLG